VRGRFLQGGAQLSTGSNPSAAITMIETADSFGFENEISLPARPQQHSTLDSLLRSHPADVSENLNTAIYSVQTFGRRYEFNQTRLNVLAVLIVLSCGTKLAATLRQYWSSRRKLGRLDLLTTDDRTRLGGCIPRHVEISTPAIRSLVGDGD
jgi:hypothetical protein